MISLLRLSALLSAAFLLSIAFSPASTQAQDARFITIWDTENSGVTDNNQIKIPGTGIDYQIIWEEVGNTSNTDTLTATDVARITFPNPGLYKVKINGGFTQIDFGDFTGGDSDKIVEVTQWGDVRWDTMFEAFLGASNLDVTAQDTPDLSNVKSMASMFQGASSLSVSESNIGQWDVSSVRTMDRMFKGALGFNGDIGQWDVSSVEDMSGMFNGAFDFNQDIGQWDVSSVTTMERMFRQTETFNQDIGQWDVSNVTDMEDMFRFADSFNQDLGSWDVSSVEDVSGMFYNVTLSPTNYDRILIGWAPQDPQDFIEFSASGSEYCNSGPFRTHLIEEFKWSINDSGLDSGCPDLLVASQARRISAESTYDFSDVATTMTFRGVTGSDGSVTLARYSDEPRNVRQGTPKPFRLVAAGFNTAFSEFEEVELRFDVSEFAGLDNPSETLVFRRPQPGTGSFTQLPTTFDQAKGELIVTADGLGEIAFANEDSPLASRLISVALQSMDLGTVLAEDTTTTSVTVTSEGNGVLEGTVELRAEGSPFSIGEGEGEYSLSTGDSLEVAIAFSPVEVSNPDRDTLEVIHNADSTDSPVEVSLKGSAAGPPSIAQFAGGSNASSLDADLGGTVNPSGDTTSAVFEYRKAGTNAFEGEVAAESPLTGTSDQSVSATATGLNPDTEYEVRLAATNDAGADTSALKSFATEAVGLAINGGGSAGLNRSFEATPGKASQSVGTFQLIADTSGAVLDSLSVTADASDNTSGVNQVALWASSDDTLGTSADAQLARRDVSGPNGFPSEVAFGGLADSVSREGRHYFVTVSLSSEGQGAVEGFLADESAVQLSGGEIESINGTDHTGFSDLPLSSNSSPLPVEMAGFEGQASDNTARLRWQTASESGNAGFDVQRRKKSGWTQVGYVESKAQGGTTTEATSYSYRAEDLPVGTHQFRLRQVDLDGRSTLTDPVSVDIRMQEAVKLETPAPNPVSTTATLSFAVEEQTETTITVYNTLGQQVATAYEGVPQAEELRTTQLDVRELASGTYFLRMEAGGQTQTQRLTVVK